MMTGDFWNKPLMQVLLPGLPGEIVNTVLVVVVCYFCVWRARSRGVGDGDVVAVVVLGGCAVFSVADVIPVIAAGKVTPSAVLLVIRIAMNGWAAWAIWQAGRPPRQRRPYRAAGRVRVLRGRLVLAPTNDGGEAR